MTDSNKEITLTIPRELLSERPTVIAAVITIIALGAVDMPDGQLQRMSGLAYHTYQKHRARILELLDQCRAERNEQAS